MKSKCCKATLLLMEELSNRIPDDNFKGEIYSTYCCEKCGLVYCLK